MIGSERDISPTPSPPYLVIDEGVAFWVETTPTSEISTTLKAIVEGCFLDTKCYDDSGRLWPILAARLKAPPTFWQRWLPGAVVAVELELGAPAHIPVADVVSRLRDVLLSEGDFMEHGPETPEALFSSLEAARTPREVIEAARECLLLVQPILATGSY